MARVYVVAFGNLDARTDNLIAFRHLLDAEDYLSERGYECKCWEHDMGIYQKPSGEIVEIREAEYHG